MVMIVKMRMVMVMIKIIFVEHILYSRHVLRALLQHLQYTQQGIHIYTLRIKKKKRGTKYLRKLPKDLQPESRIWNSNPHF